MKYGLLIVKPRQSEYAKPDEEHPNNTLHASMLSAASNFDKVFILSSPFFFFLSFVLDSQNRRV